MPVTPLAAAATDIPGLWVLRVKEASDDRGVVREFFRAGELGPAVGGAPGPWLQVNVTDSRRGALRGLHGEHMHKLVGVVAGAAFGAYVDTRRDSPTFGRVVTVELVPGIQVLVPPGVCNGFQATAEGLTQYLYCLDREWSPDMPGTAVHPLDPDLAIAWPIPPDPDDRTVVSAKDAALPRLAELC